MACNQAEQTLYDTVTTTTTGELTTFTTELLSTDVISGAFPSSLCAESSGGTCIRSTVGTLSFTYTTVATSQVVLTTRPEVTITSTRPTRTISGVCVSTSESSVTLPNGSVSISSIYITIGGSDPTGSSSDPGKNEGGSSKKNNGAIIGGAVAGAIALIALIAVIWILWRRNRKMARLIQANEEEEKRNGEINVAQLLPSPYVQHPPAFSTTDGLSGYPPSSAGPYPEYAMSSPSDRRISSPNGFSAHQDMDLSALAAGRAATTQYTPTHSRAGSQLTHDPARPHSMVLSAHDPTTLSRPNSAVPPEASSSNLAPESAASAKAREAYQHRRALIAQNAAEGDDGDIIIPENAQAVRGNVPPSAWAMPPPAYSPDS